MKVMAEVCGAVHKEAGLACSRPPGANAYNEDRNENVHQHWARDPQTNAVWHWEDEPH